MSLNNDWWEMFVQRLVHWANHTHMHGQIGVYRINIGTQHLFVSTVPVNGIEFTKETPERGWKTNCAYCMCASNLYFQKVCCPALLSLFSCWIVDHYIMASSLHRFAKEICDTITSQLIQSHQYTNEPNHKSNIHSWPRYMERERSCLTIDLNWCFFLHSHCRFSPIHRTFNATFAVATSALGVTRVRSVGKPSQHRLALSNTRIFIRRWSHFNARCALKHTPNFPISAVTNACMPIVVCKSSATSAARASARWHRCQNINASVTQRRAHRQHRPSTIIRIVHHRLVLVQLAAVFRKYHRPWRLRRIRSWCSAVRHHSSHPASPRTMDCKACSQTVQHRRPHSRCYSPRNNSNNSTRWIGNVIARHRHAMCRLYSLTRWKYRRPQPKRRPTICDHHRPDRFQSICKYRRRWTDPTITVTIIITIIRAITTAMQTCIDRHQALKCVPMVG